jgi:hypothetical protein
MQQTERNVIAANVRDITAVGWRPAHDATEAAPRLPSQSSPRSAREAMTAERLNAPGVWAAATHNRWEL